MESEQIQLERDERGLFKGYQYVFKKDGRVDYKAMLKQRPEFLYVLFDKLDEVEKKYGKTYNVADIDEKYLCITLPGIEYLAWLRGYLAAIPNIQNSVYDPQYEKVVSCTATYTVTWIGNFESGMNEVAFGHGAGANLRNTFDFTSNYIETMALNRAWSKTVRMFLGINIVSREEVGPKDENPSAPVKAVLASTPAPQTEVTAQSMLRTAADKKKLNFEEFRAAVKARYTSKIKCDITTINDFADIPTNDAYTLLGILSEAKK